MGAPKYDDSFKARVASLWAARDIEARQGLKYFADLLGVHRKVIYLYQNWPDPPVPRDGAETSTMVDEIPATGTILSRDKSGDTDKIEFLSRTKIVTEKDCLAYGEVDEKRWYVKRMKMGAWGTPMKLNQGTTSGGKAADKPVYVQMWKVSVELELIAPRAQLDALALVFDEMRQYAPVYRTPRYELPRGRQTLCLLALHDIHFGKLCWAQETGQDYDLAIARDRFRDAVEDLLNDASPYSITEFLMPIGSDLFHIDTDTNTTTKGTYQHVDGRMPKIFKTVKQSLVWAIELLAEVAPVHAKYVPGNHDKNQSYMMSECLDSHFHRHTGVFVDCAPTARKYHRYGCNLIGMTHGDKEKRSELPGIMADERKRDWAETTCREWIIGHRHQSIASHSTPVKGQQGVGIFTARSLSGTDEWHASQGFVSNDQAAEAFLYDKETGRRGGLIARPRRLTSGELAISAA